MAEYLEIDVATEPGLLWVADQVAHCRRHSPSRWYCQSADAPSPVPIETPAKLGWGVLEINSIGQALRTKLPAEWAEYQDDEGEPCPDVPVVAATHGLGVEGRPFRSTEFPLHLPPPMCADNTAAAAPAGDTFYYNSESKASTYEHPLDPTFNSQVASAIADPPSPSPASLRWALQPDKGESVTGSAETQAD